MYEAGNHSEWYFDKYENVGELKEVLFIEAYLTLNIEFNKLGISEAPYKNISLERWVRSCLE